MTLKPRRADVLPMAEKMATEFDRDQFENFFNDHSKINKYSAIFPNSTLFPVFCAPSNNIGKKIYQIVYFINSALDEFHDIYGDDVYINNNHSIAKFGDMNLDEIYFKIHKLFVKNSSYDKSFKDICICIDFLRTNGSVYLFFGLFIDIPHGKDLDGEYTLLHVSYENRTVCIYNKSNS